MRLNKWLLATFLAFAFVALAAAQSPRAAQALVLEFVDGDNLDIVYPDSTTFSYSNGSIQEGDTIPVGATVRTGAGTNVELRLKPNGTVIKLAKMTTFRVEGLSTPQKDHNGFTLVSGKIRAIAATGSQYSVYTSTTVAGVRGTDFSMSFQEGAKALLLVKRGKVEFGARGEGDAIANAIMVSAGQFADFFKGLKAAPFTPEILGEEYGDMDIPDERAPAQADEPAPDEAAGQDEALALEPDAEGDKGTDKDAAAAGDKAESPFVAWLGEVLGMEIGSITINEQTWAKAVIQPTFKIGKLKAGLYLPIIYSDNLFDPSTWYRPGGNDEWSFGFDQDTWTSALGDAASDLALKIKFIEYGQPLEDPFFVKAGNLSSFTIGHGLLMRNYANDADFPSVRHIGLNIGMDLGSWGFEALTNDLVDNQIIGGRLYVRPLPSSKLAFGLSAAADLFPASDLSAAEADLYGDPIFIGGAVDMDLPILEADALGLRFFADGAAMVPYVRNGGASAGDAGFRFDMVYSNGALTNWGAATGFIGNVLFIDWRLEYRYFTGVFSSPFFDTSYERRRSTLVKEWADYLSGAEEIDQSPSVMGVYGEGGFSFMRDKLSMTFGYFWPWAAGATSLDEQLSTSDDYFKAQLVVKKGLIPVIDLAGAITYERRSFIQSIVNGEAMLFDENTVFSGELSFPIPGAPNLDLALIVSTTIERINGEAVYTSDGETSIVPAITLETRLHF